MYTHPFENKERGQWSGDPKINLNPVTLMSMWDGQDVGEVGGGERVWSI